MANEQFLSDVERFFRKVEHRIELVAYGVAEETHTRLVDMTPYRTGRARASWNLSPNVPDFRSAPPNESVIGVSSLHATPEEIAQANVFYDSIIASKQRRSDPPPGTNVWHVTNTVEYIEDLNHGRSKQAPAGFFNAVVAGAGTIADRIAATLSKG